MDILVLDTNFNAVDIIDTYESFIWTDRYNEYGDFELYIAANSEHMSKLQKGYYLWNSNSEHVMIIDTKEIDSDIENGNKMIISGSSLESILNRRIIWGQTIISGNLQDGIKYLLEKNVINPSIAERKINNFVFKESTDATITNLKIQAQFTGDNLYDAIRSICNEYQIGFKITLNDNNQFVFELYSGINRSYSQSINPYIVFSPNFENIINSNYYDSDKNLKTVTLVAGEGEGADRRVVVVTDQNGGGSDLDRREMFTDARDISSIIEGDQTLSDDDYNAQLAQRGSEDLYEYDTIKSFDGQVETSYMYKYGEDFFMGDIVQLADEYGNEVSSRVTEYIYSHDSNGIEAYPTFSSIE